MNYLKTFEVFLNEKLDYSNPTEFKNPDELFNNKGKAKAKYVDLYFLLLSTKEGKKFTSFISNDKDKLDEIALKYNQEYSGVITKLSASRYTSGRTVYHIRSGKGVLESSFK